MADDKCGDSHCAADDLWNRPGNNSQKEIRKFLIMQEKRNKQLLVSLVLLVLITAVLYLFFTSEHVQQIDKTIFQVEDLKTIDRVVLASKKGKVELAYNGSRWMVNDRYNADGNMIQVLF